MDGGGVRHPKMNVKIYFCLEVRRIAQENNVINTHMHEVYTCFVRILEESSPKGSKIEGRQAIIMFILNANFIIAT